MSIIERYIIKFLLKNTLLTLSVLLGIFMFGSLTREIGDIGKGQYDIIEALKYVWFTSPRLAYELLPIAVAIGSMATFGMLSKTSELVIIYAAGVSYKKMFFILLKASIILSVFSMSINEWVVPYTERIAQHDRDIAQFGFVHHKRIPRLWLKEGQQYININKINHHHDIANIYTYQMNDDWTNLHSVSYASQGKYIPDTDSWTLFNIQKTELKHADQLASLFIPKANLALNMDPEQLSISVMEPDYLSIFEMHAYSQYLEKNGLNNIRYQQVFWLKLIAPMIILAMLLLPLSWSWLEGRSMGMEQRIFIGILVSVIFHFCNETAHALGQVYNLPPFLTVTMPTLILLALITISLNEIHTNIRRAFRRGLLKEANVT